jgi:hypothetical protein
MPKFEIELDDKGEFVGAVAPEFVSVLDRIKSASHGEGFGKGAQKAAEEAKAQIASTVAAEKIKLESAFAADRVRWGEIEELNKVLKTQLDGTMQEHRKTLTAQSEAHADEITRRVKALTVRDDQIRALVNQSLKGLAAQFGTHEESLPELEVILQHRIGYTDDMVPFVRGEDGQPAKTTAGNALGIDVFVKQYLDNHAHHRKPAPGRGGDARGGASLRAHGSGATDFDQAKARIDGGDRSVDAINEAFSARLSKRKSA